MHDACDGSAGVEAVEVPSRYASQRRSSLRFDRIYDNFGHTIDSDAAAAVRRSASRYGAWARGELDAHT